MPADAPHVSQRVKNALHAMSPFMGFFATSTWTRRREEAGVCDFVFGNPHEMPLEGFVSALGRWHVPRNKDWYAYKMSEEGPRRVVAEGLRRWRDLPFDAEDILLTNGGFAALAVSLCALVDPGDEVVFISPPWFFYEALIAAYSARPVRVQADPESFDLDLEAIASALSEKTRAIIVNSPNNPTGKVYPPETLRGLAQLLAEASARHGRTVYLLSDEAYSRVVFDGRISPSPTAFYPHSLLLYTYGKTLLTPGQRLGYIALPPAMPEREALREALFTAQLVTGYAFPNALLQHALADLEGLSLDVEHLQGKRDRMVAALREMGYALHVPEGTFYLLARSPMADDLAFSELLAQHDIFVLPGSVVELPGTFRVSLTASDEMIERSLPGFAAAWRAAEHSSTERTPS